MFLICMRSFGVLQLLYIFGSVVLIDRTDSQRNVEIYVLVNNLETNDFLFLDEYLHINIACDGIIDNSSIEARIIINNSTWSRQIDLKQPMYNDLNNTYFWEYNLTRGFFNYPTHDRNPPEQWLLNFAVSENDTTLAAIKKSLLDIKGEPVLQWSIGRSSLESPENILTTADKLLLTYSPCASDVVILSPQYRQEISDKLYFAVSHNAFESSLEWYYVTVQDLASGGISQAVRRTLRSTTQCYQCHQGMFFQQTDYENCMATQTVQDCPAGTTDCYIDYQVLNDGSISLKKACWTSMSACEDFVSQKINVCHGPNTPLSQCAVCCTDDLCNEFIPGYPPGRETTEPTASSREPTTQDSSQTFTEPAIINDPSCIRIVLLSMKLTNRHLVLLTSCGVFVSNDLAIYSHSINQTMYFRKTLSISSLCDIIIDGFLSYSQRCLSLGFTPEGINEFLAVQYSCSNGYKASLYSQNEFRNWTDAEYLAAEYSDSAVVDLVYDYNTEKLVLLSLNAENEYRINNLYLNSSGYFQSNTSLPGFIFPVGVNFNSMLIHPLTKHVYCIGHQIWLSAGGGSHLFHKISQLNDDSFVTYTFIQHQQHSFVMKLSDGNFLFTKPGVQRVLKLEYSSNEVNFLLFDQINHVYSLTLNASGNLMKNYFDVKTIILQHVEHGRAPVVFSPVSRRESKLYQMKLEDNEQCVFGYNSIGKYFTQQNGTKALISNVISSNSSLNTVCVVEVIHEEQFVLENSVDSPALLSDVYVDMTDISSQQVVVILQDVSGGGWNTIDQYKSVVFKNAFSVLLTNFINSSHFDGIAVVNISNSFIFNTGSWFMVNLGIDQTSGHAFWDLTEGECQHTVEFEDKLNLRSAVVLDMDESYLLQGQVKYTGFYTQEMSMMVPDFHKLDYFSVTSDIQKGRGIDNFTISIKPHMYEKAATTLNILFPLGSLTCEQSVYSFQIITGCPCSKKMTFWYPYEISEEEYLHGKPLDKKGKALLYHLPVNYRPPSELGIAIPTSAVVYNVDTSKTVPFNSFKVSQQRVNESLCWNSDSDLTECECSQKMEMSSDYIYSHCKKKVYQMRFPALLKINLTIDSDNIQKNLSPKHGVFLWEMNGRYPIIQSQILVLNSELHQSGNYKSQLYNPQDISVLMNGSGLYHFRVEIAPGISYCRLYAEFQVFVFGEPLAYPLMFIINFSTAICMGGIIFVFYLFYMWQVNPSIVHPEV